MNVELGNLAEAVTGRPLIAVVLSYSVFPYAVLWLAVRLWPKDHPRRAELLAEYDAVEWYIRPIWVGDVGIRCLLDGLAERWTHRRARGDLSLRRRWLERTWVITVLVFTVTRLMVARATLNDSGIDIVVFGVIDLVTALPYALGTARVVEAVVDRDRQVLGRWTLVAAASFIAPYCYLAWAGANEGLPTQVYVVFGALVAIYGANAVWNVRRAITRRRTT